MDFKFLDKQKAENNNKSKVTINSNMRDYSQEMFFVNKANAAKEVLAQSRFPEGIARR